ncbi:hypothetical protein C7C46_06930 [Streptomyces tateyamensis]|uniref:Uncharacterized protein n=1 Tax=Streptomyces tateyamensis TaxID=565073 RepID=A0A2V4NR65_9ACTN|nr:hypothetical protein [Streptomyces tateyamensis]PYC85460.1 hypothetical protein C7C46_06930 [Streptomyces tateyamensis]
MDHTTGSALGHDRTALDEIELTGELMIAATDSPAERLPTDRIDEVLLHRPRPAADRPVSSAAAD